MVEADDRMMQNSAEPTTAAASMRREIIVEY
jgi:hypothetical protein